MQPTTSDNLIPADQLLSLPWVKEGMDSQLALPTCPACGPRPPKARLVLGTTVSMPDVCEHQAAILAKRSEKLRAGEELATQRARLGRWKVPAEFEGRRLSDIDPERPGSKKGLAFAEFYLADWRAHMAAGRGLVLHGVAASSFDNPGSPGTGKTLVATTIAAELERHGVPVAYLKCRQLNEALRSFGDARAQAIAVLENAAFAVLDELVNEHETAFTAQPLIGGLDARHEAGLPTLITSNFERAAIAAHFEAALTRGDGGDTPQVAQVKVRRMISRMTPPRFVWVPFDGPDQRLAQRSTWGPTFD